MDPNAKENIFSACHFRSIEVVDPTIPSYKFVNYPQQNLEQQQYQMNVAQLNSQMGDYSTSTVDVNKNFSAIPGIYSASLPYFNETGLTNHNNNYSNQSYKIPSKYAGNGTTYSLISQERNVASQCEGIGVSGGSSFASNAACQYAHNYGSTCCNNRHRYMPYNHNRVCAAAAATASAAAMGTIARYSGSPLYTTCGASTAVSTVANNVAVVPPLIYSSYQQLGVNYQGIHSILPQPPGMCAPFNIEAAANPAIIAPCDRITPTTMPDYPHFPCNLPSSTNSSFQRSANTIDSNIADQSANTQKTLIHAKSSTVGSTGAASTTTSSVTDVSQAVCLRLTNLDYTMDEESLRKFLLAQLKPITPVVSLTFEDSNFATVTVPDSYFAKQVVANLHRKKIGHKRMLVSYTRDSSLTEANTLRCQVAGLLKDVPGNRLPMYKFRELFQSRFKTSISVLDLYAMRDICIINSDNNEEKHITLQPSLANSLETSPLMEGLQHTVPYCTEHFKREQHKGWAEQEIEPLPNVFMTICEIQTIICPLLKNHRGDVPIASLLHCVEGQLKVKIQPNESGVNLEHLVCCIQGIKVQMNNFGIKILGWFESDRRSSSGALSNGLANISTSERGTYFKSADPLSQITREVIELVKMSPKSTMKFSRFIPAYHNHFGKQCRVADYGYTKLIELFEALSCVVQIMGDGENRQITLTHRTQVRRFTSDLLRILRSSGNKSVLLSELPNIFAKTQNRTFDVTDYGVCDIGDILDGLVNSNVVVVSKVQSSKDILISIPKRKQTNAEVAKTCIFAAEMVELLRNSPQYTIPFQKLVRSYHYHFAYQCRLSDYGFLKLADLIDAIQGVVELDPNNDEDRRIFLSPNIAQRVFAEQCEELIRKATGSSKTSIKLEEVLKLHKKKFGYQIQLETLGVDKIATALELLPYIEVYEEKASTWIICHNDDPIFRTLCYRACKHVLAYDALKYRTAGNTKRAATKENNVVENQKQIAAPTLDNFIIEFNIKYKENLNVRTVKAMRHAIEIYSIDSCQYVRISKFMEFVIHIVRLLEQRPMMLVSDIKNAKDCTINTTFSFGYPNLITMLTAYPDIFIVNLGVSYDSSEVRLAPNLATMKRNLNGDQKIGTDATKHLQLKLNTTNQPRPALVECNGNNTQVNYNEPPLMKIRHTASGEVHNPMNAFKNNDMNNNSFYQNTTTANASPFYANNISHSLASSCSSYSSAASYANLHNSSFLNSSFANVSGNGNKENSLNSSLNFSASFNSSSASLSDLSFSLGSTSAMPLSSSTMSGSSGYSTTKLWERRQESGPYYRPQPRQHYQNNLDPFEANLLTNYGNTLQPLEITKLNIPPQPLQTPLITQNNLYDIVNTIQMGPPSTPMFDPPKPDSPPNHNMPFWIDPVWSHNSNEQKIQSNSLNFKQPESRNANLQPMVVSPYTLSQIANMKKTVNFDTMDRKIA